MRWSQNETLYWLSLLVATIYESDGSAAEAERKTDDSQQKKRRRPKLIKFGVVCDSTTVSLMPTTTRS